MRDFIPVEALVQVQPVAPIYVTVAQWLECDSICQKPRYTMSVKSTQNYCGSREVATPTN